MGVFIREAGVEDAEGIWWYMKRLVDEGGLYIGFEPGEFGMSVEDEVDFVLRHAEADNSVVFLAVAEGDGGDGDSNGEEGRLVDGELVGLLNCSGSTRWAMRHESTLGVSVKAGWRGQGVGRRMMERAIEWAEGNEVVKRLQLEVYAENVGAMRLYEDLGFEVEGVKRRAAWKMGRWMDSVVMARLF